MSEEEINFLEIVDLKKGFGSWDTRQEVLCGMNFSVAKGEFCVLLGPSVQGNPRFLILLEESTELIPDIFPFTVINWKIWLKRI